jgi:hypothetical protein
MNTVLSTRVDEQHHKHPPGTRVHVERAARVSLADRVALRLGLALITWSRRSRTVAPRPTLDELHARTERAAERTARERRWARELHLGHPWR